MEIGQLHCDNLGMTKDFTISALSQSKDGSTNFAFENHNIRILPVNDNTKFAITNEKSTRYESTILGTFLGGCQLGKYLVLFIKDPTRYLGNINTPDIIYRIEYKQGTGTVDVVELFAGDLKLSVDKPLEAIGFYESEEVQKVYWVDGENQNRFINIVANPKIGYYVSNTGSASYTDPEKTVYLYKALVADSTKDITITGGKLCALCTKDGMPQFYVAIPTGSSLTSGQYAYHYSDIATITDIANLPSTPITYVGSAPQYTNFSFDFQGEVTNIPKVTITKDYNKAGTFQAGVIQYFISYYNKYGVETGLVWNSDLQYLTLSDRGAKADEAVSCAFDLEITNLERVYDYLRVYACYRSGKEGIVSSRIVADINLADKDLNSVVVLTDFGAEGRTFASGDMAYIGGQNIIANTLDYKQDTLFLGDIHTPDAKTNIVFPKKEVDVTDAGKFSDTTKIQEGVYTDAQNNEYPYLTWAYKYVSPIANRGLYQYDNELLESQEEVAGFKWRELYRFGIQFMDNKGTWTPAYWLGDKLCTLPPRVFTSNDIAYSGNPATPVMDKGVYVKNDYYLKSNGCLITEEEATTVYVNTNDYEVRKTYFDYTKDGCYIANVLVDIDAIKQSVPQSGSYVAYRLLVANTDITNRRIVEQGVINPTMFKYAERFFNQPFSMPSWLFRPRNSRIVNRHYDTLPVQTEENAELQGVVKRQVPGFKPTEGNFFNAYLFIFAANEVATTLGFEQWKLIYYNCGTTDLERAEKMYLLNWTNQPLTDDHGNPLTVPDSEYQQVAELLVKYSIPIKNVGGVFGDTIGQNIIYVERVDSTHTKVGPKDNMVTYVDSDAITTIKGYLTDSNSQYRPTQIYGKNYKVISSRLRDDNVPKSGSKWSTLRGWLVDEITNDMRMTTVDEVGDAIAGKIVLSAAMLPSEEDIRDIARDGAGGEEIVLAIVAVIVAAAAVVLTALSVGLLAPAVAAGTTAALGAAVAASACSAAAIGAASGAATLAQEHQDMNELSRRMLAKGYTSCASGVTTSQRRERSKAIGQILEHMFWPAGYTQNASAPGLGGYDWLLPVLQGEPSTGHVFRTKHPWTESGALGMDYNAYMRGGKLTNLEEGEIDVRKKQNMFCIDESIVTLNAPDVEDNVYSVDNTDTLRLDLVGVIPINSTYGIYDLKTESGLNTNSQVLQGRFVADKIEDGVSSIGMLNADNYQDFAATEEQFDVIGTTDEGDAPQRITVGEETAVYRTFMWNRATSAGFWFPGALLKDGFGEDISEPKGKILSKVFANLRYSVNTAFYPPFTLNIERPAVCLDEQTMLKVLRYAGDSKNYYENVDTISINTSYYPLIADKQPYPSLQEHVTLAGLQDPVTIRYRATSHIVLPLVWNELRNATTILPYLSTEDVHTPANMYDPEDIEGINLYGTTEAMPIGPTYQYLEVPNMSATDSWNKEGECGFTDMVRLSGILNPTRGLEAAINGLTIILSKTTSEVISGAYSGESYTELLINNSIDVTTKLLDEGKQYLVRMATNAYYLISKNPDSSSSNPWVSHKVTSIPANSKIITLTDSLDGTSGHTSSVFKSFVGVVSSDGTKWSIHPAYPSQDKNKTIANRYWGFVKLSSYETGKLGTVLFSSENASADDDKPSTNLFRAIHKSTTSGTTTYHIDMGTELNLPVIASHTSVGNPLPIYPLAKLVGTSYYIPTSSPSGLRYTVDAGANTNTVVAPSSFTEIIANETSFKVLRHATTPQTCWRGPSQDDKVTVGKALNYEELTPISGRTHELVVEHTYYAVNTADANNYAEAPLTASGIVLSKYPDTGMWSQSQLPWNEKGATPYLFLGELVKKNFDYSSWNGGTSDYALQQLTWNVASKVTPISDNISKVWGDTFYQRWDCEKTYPYTEEDPNSTVEILSFMLESHKNLDGRCDVNRGTHNLRNIRPRNTVFNEVYNQSDNFFTYKVLDDKFSKNHFEADVAWSLTKNNMDDIDKWTCLLAANEMSLDGRYGTLRKIINVNDVLVAFQDKGISTIKYNENAALSTTSGLPVQMGNTGKVDGYRLVSENIGCHNKFSINKNSAGLFFADDINKTFNQWTVNGGVTNIGMLANFSYWFKKNLNGNIWDARTRSNFRTSYDEMTHDLYIIRKDTCLIYNTLLGKFTSFMDYVDTPMIVRLTTDSGITDSFAIRSTVNSAVRDIVEVWKMFSGASFPRGTYSAQGAYGYIYGQFRPYSMEYRLNPDPMHDSIFTNYQYTADWTDPTKEVDETNLFDANARRFTTFDTVEAKNEYQSGIMSIQQKNNIPVGFNRVFGRQPIKSMFRVWRGDIPRHGDNLRGVHTPMSDRMRNPWIHLKFEKNTADDSKMTFHDLTVTYYNQYGRI